MDLSENQFSGQIFAQDHLRPRSESLTYLNIRYLSISLSSIIHLIRSIHIKKFDVNSEVIILRALSFLIYHRESSYWMPATTNSQNMPYLPRYVPLRNLRMTHQIVQAEEHDEVASHVAVLRGKQQHGWKSSVSLQ